MENAGAGFLSELSNGHLWPKSHITACGKHLVAMLRRCSEKRPGTVSLGGFLTLQGLMADCDKPALEHPGRPGLGQILPAPVVMLGEGIW